MNHSDRTHLLKIYQLIRYGHLNYELKFTPKMYDFAKKWLLEGGYWVVEL